MAETHDHRTRRHPNRFRASGIAVVLAIALGASACNAPAPKPIGTKPTPTKPSAACNNVKGLTMAALIRKVFACELRRKGVPSATIAAAVTQADRVAWCESRHQPNAVVFGGKYVNTPNPRTGYRYSAAGLFQIIRSTANAYVPGGYAKVKDPVANTKGAAALWHWGYTRHRNPWQPWECRPGSAAERSSSAQR